MQLKYFNALAPPPDLYIVLHFRQLSFDKYDAGQQLHKCSYALQVKLLGTKNAPSFCLIIILYDKQYQTSSESNITQVFIFLIS